jgi:hypothetical protein
MTSPASERLRRELETSHRLGKRISDPGFDLPALERLQDFQRRRLASTYQDLRDNPRYTAAVEFFLAELYGGLHFMERDQQVQRALPLLTRMLPDHMQETLADAFRLQELSLALDLRLVEVMLAEHREENLDDRLYGVLYRTVPRPEREEQIQLINDLGIELNLLVKHRLVMLLLGAMRRPARAAGFGALQQFLEDGLGSFAAMKDSHEFVATIRERETQIMNRLYAAEDRPFDLSGEG